MHEVSVSVPGHSREYRILIGNGLLGKIRSLLDVERYTKLFILTDQNAGRHWLNKLQQAIGTPCPYLVLPAGEETKRIATVERIWRSLRQAQCDRKSLLIALGGGVVGDMAGFAASTYMRGMPFVQIPTTLLAQVDSSIGGKTGFDFVGLKNLIGTFAQPEAVIIDASLLATLSRRQLLAGYAEMIKHGLIKDAAYFERLTQKPVFTCTTDELVELITHSTRIKAAIVQSDETESGERKVLNFGHTIGHAIEALSWRTTQPLLHGEAVAIGMVVEANLSQQMGYLTTQDVTKLTRSIREGGLPTVIPRLSLPQIVRHLHADKKNEGGIVKFTLLEHIGGAVYDQVVEEPVVRRAILANMESVHAK